MDKIIFESCNGGTIVIDGENYPCEVVGNWSSDELAVLRDKAILRNQRESRAKESAIYDAFQPYITKAIVRETQRNEQRDLAQMIRRMPEEDVIAVFTIYFDEILNKKNGDDSKNE